ASLSTCSTVTLGSGIAIGGANTPGSGGASVVTTTGTTSTPVEDDDAFQNCATPQLVGTPNDTMRLPPTITKDIPSTNTTSVSTTPANRRQKSLDPLDQSSF
ncbi:unnamed protein product, partial [Meganyctiphanes norvegica]